MGVSSELSALLEGGCASRSFVARGPSDAESEVRRWS
jgi:hypothetical protein